MSEQQIAANEAEVDAKPSDAAVEDSEIEVEVEEDVAKAFRQSSSEDNADAEPDEEDDEEDDEDERLSADQRDDEDDHRAKKRQRRKERDRRKREEQERRLLTLQQELLIERQERVRDRLRQEAFRMQGEARDIDGQIGEITRRYQQAEKIYADAVSNNQGVRAAQAQRAMQELSAKYNQVRDVRSRIETNYAQLEQAWQQVNSAPPPPPEVEVQAPAPQASPDLVRHAKKFMRENQWYRLGASKGDSKVVDTIDQELAQQGFDASTEEYWSELRSRVRKALPHRFRDGGRVSSGSPPVGGNRDAATPGMSRIVLSREVVQACKDAGFWDDPKERSDYFRRVMNAQKQERARARAN